MSRVFAAALFAAGALILAAALGAAIADHVDAALAPTDLPDDDLVAGLAAAGVADIEDMLRAEADHA